MLEFSLLDVLLIGAAIGLGQGVARQLFRAGARSILAIGHVRRPFEVACPVCEVLGPCDCHACPTCRRFFMPGMSSAEREGMLAGLSASLGRVPTVEEARAVFAAAAMPPEAVPMPPAPPMSDAERDDMLAGLELERGRPPTPDEVREAVRKRRAGCGSPACVVCRGKGGAS